MSTTGATMSRWRIGNVAKAGQHSNPAGVSPAQAQPRINRQNRMKRLIRADKPAYGVSVQFPSAEIVEMIGELAFDRVMLGAEHGSITPDNAGPAVINKYLDRGAMGVQVPHVNTAAEARAVVEGRAFTTSRACGDWAVAEWPNLAGVQRSRNMSRMPTGKRSYASRSRKWRRTTTLTKSWG